MSERPESNSLWRLLTTWMWSSLLSAAGVVLVTISAFLILASILLDLAGYGSGPYQGLVSFMFLPGVFIFGLALIPLGAYLAWAKQRKQGGGARAVALTVDLGDPAQRRFWGLVLILTIINVLLISAASYHGYHYTESTAFCGTLCHTVMEPEHTAYSRSPHARVACVQCHIGGGASWFVKSKMSGLRQVWAVAAGTYSRPIPTPIEDLRPARETCEECHWPQVFHGNRTKTFRRVIDDENPLDPEVTAVLLKVGGLDKRSGDYHGIHWHISDRNRVVYRSDPKRETIREVRVTRPDGTVDLYVKNDLPPLPDEAPWRVMDCLDCHNRPTHIYERAESAVDALILKGAPWAALPGLKPLLLDAVTRDYPDADAARQGIEDALVKGAAERDPEGAPERREGLLAAAREAFQEVWSPNIFPKMAVTWDTYPTHLGHRDGGGCFRCHSEEHNTAEGKTISQDCESCHVILVDQERASALPENLKGFLD